MLLLCDFQMLLVKRLKREILEYYQSAQLRHVLKIRLMSAAEDYFLPGFWKEAIVSTAKFLETVGKSLAV